ncbi:hypothetical protein F6X56_15065 [Rhodococcus erythropolis]|uniref:hypothetical protein n=1 Tax=Rhodococcus erythropolis TaxID=1833 RepID=UPI001243F2F3|nr:hypothetical protein [Rhodococcus erythropolis]QEX10942.1 hypothetical protein F6X56_15065 [Rhodococcus erythropolis]
MTTQSKQEERTADELKSLMLDHLQNLVFGETKAVDYDYAEYLLNRLLSKQVVEVLEEIEGESGELIVNSHDDTIQVVPLSVIQTIKEKYL